MPATDKYCPCCARSREVALGPPSSPAPPETPSVSPARPTPSPQTPGGSKKNPKNRSERRAGLYEEFADKSRFVLVPKDRRCQPCARRNDPCFVDHESLRRKKCCSCRKGSCNFKDDPPNVDELLSLAARAPEDKGATTESDDESDDESESPGTPSPRAPKKKAAPTPSPRASKKRSRLVSYSPSPPSPPSPPSTRRAVRRRTAAQTTAPPPPAPAAPPTATASPPPLPSRQLSPETLGIINLLSFTSDEGMREYLRQRLTKKGVLTDPKGPSGSGSGSGSKL
ncbi:hypothetical protein DB88DRAFT_474119 [Papiliotrema laurentii]|uniref:Uncharacterized protein n=1 Tax=Papiliotrema laurentii TaxID=5418 RepID=A0AAD9CXL2_PAPLA|nr:hypothetical protein DB88DRAFT_474119 [Papiliotrema laurentii]